MKPSGIGGQALIEGVMMRNKDKVGVSLRKPNNEIITEVWDCEDPSKKKGIAKMPIVRGVIAFVESMKVGMKALNYSADVASIDEETIKNETEKERAKREAKDKAATTFASFIAIILALGIFVWLPLMLSELLKNNIEEHWIRALIEGGVRVLLFIGYVVAISLIPDIKRVFMYHGAEHKAINCIENGYVLSVKNVKRQSREHRRCGTNFLLIVVLLSVLFFVVIDVENVGLKMLLRILLIPVIAGVPYEWIKFAGSTDNKLVIALNKPGLLLQKLTTREPDDKMIEVAIASVEAVFDWKKFEDEHKDEFLAARKKQKKKAASKKKSKPAKQTPVKQTPVKQTPAVKKAEPVKKAEALKKVEAPKTEVSVKAEINEKQAAKEAAAQSKASKKKGMINVVDIDEVDLSRLDIKITDLPQREIDPEVLARLKNDNLRSRVRTDVQPLAEVKIDENDEILKALDKYIGK